MISGTIRGLPEGGSANIGPYKMTNSTGSRVTIETTFGAGIANATTWSAPTNAKYMLIIMPTTNTNAWRLAGTTAEAGIAMSSRDPTLISISTLMTTYYGYTSSTRAISGVRIIFA